MTEWSQAELERMRNLRSRARDLLEPESADFWAQHDSGEDPTGAAIEAIACLLLADSIERAK